MNGLVVVLNAGSSSVKFSVFEPADGDLNPIAKGQIEGIITAPRFVAKDAERGDIGRKPVGRPVSAEEAHGKAFEALGEWLREYTAGTKLTAVGHRVVLGGPKYSASVLINEAVLADLEALVPLMPLHQPHNLKPIRAIATTQARASPDRLFRYRIPPGPPERGRPLRSAR